MKKTIELSLPELVFVAATRGALGCGVGLLAGQRLGRRTRRRLGTVLLALGALTTVPAALLIRGRLAAARLRAAPAAA